MMLIRSILTFLCCCNCALAWDSEQLEVFDVVEEVKENFYNLLNISQVSNNLPYANMIIDWYLFLGCHKFRN